MLVIHVGINKCIYFCKQFNFTDVTLIRKEWMYVCVLVGQSHPRAHTHTYIHTRTYLCIDMNNSSPCVCVCVVVVIRWCGRGALRDH